MAPPYPNDPPFIMGDVQEEFQSTPGTEALRAHLGVGGPDGPEILQHPTLINGTSRPGFLGYEPQRRE